jgi:hypothetical protein
MNPHPMCLLPAVRQLLDDLPVDRGLRVYKAPEVERIGHATTLFHSHQNRLVGLARLTLTR